jgi:membrane protease YdiL (CAAX protease family)
VLLEACLVPVALVLGWIVRQPAFADFALEPKAALRGVAAALPLIALMALAMRFPVGPLANIKDFLVHELVPTLERCRWPDLALVCVTAGFGEEMLFRGVIQGALSRLLGPAAGIAIASVLFGLFHPISMAYVIVAGAIGAYLGIVWLLSGNLLTPIVAHALYDFVTLLVLSRARLSSAESIDRTANHPGGPQP